MKHGDRVQWTYTHYLNQKSSFRRTKFGEYIGLVRHTIKHEGSQLAWVKFDGNKGFSRVNFHELKIVKK